MTWKWTIRALQTSAALRGRLNGSPKSFQVPCRRRRQPQASTVGRRHHHHQRTQNLYPTACLCLHQPFPAFRGHRLHRHRPRHQVAIRTAVREGPFPCRCRRRRRRRGLLDQRAFLATASPCRPALPMAMWPTLRRVQPVGGSRPPRRLHRPALLVHHQAFHRVYRHRCHLHRDQR